MSNQIAKLGVGLLLCFLVLFVQLNRVTVFGAQELKDNPKNTRAILRDFDAPRGTIVTADEVVVARSDATPDGSRFDFARTYPEGDLFAHTVGYFSLNLGAAGVEDSYNAELAGRTLDLSFRRFDDLFVDRDRVGDVRLTLRADVQRVAKDLLGERQGSVVAIDPRSGELLALWSWPSFDPNALATQDFGAANDTFTLLQADESDPLLAKTYRERFFPGSTFKVVTAAAGLADGSITADQPVVPGGSRVHAAADDPAPAELRRVDLRREPLRHPAGVVQHRLRPDGRRPRRGHDGRPGRRRSASTRRRRSTCPHPPGRSSRRTSSRTCRRSRRPASARTTCRPPRCRWRWSPPPSPTKAGS